MPFVLRNDVMKILIIEDKIFHDTIIRIYRRTRTGECDKCSCVVDKGGES